MQVGIKGPIFAVIALGICSQLSAYGSAVPGVRNRDIPPYVVPSVTVNGNDEIIRKLILDRVQVKYERDDSYYQTHGFKGGISSSRVWVPFVAEVKEKSTFGKKFFRNPAHESDIYVHSSGQTFASSFYFSDAGPLECSTDFAISLEKSDAEHVKITVHSLNTVVYKGRQFNAHVFGLVPTRVPVPAAPTDEYRLLMYIVHVLGVELEPLDDIQ
jgi:hypothetical protein